MKVAGKKRDVLGELAALVLVAAFALAPVRVPMPPAGKKPAPPQMPAFTKLRYDSMMSVNDQCPVRHGHLNPGIRPMYVNRQPIGFC